ncbi:MAG: hypothetical protein RR531_00490 [Longicatena sp.]
MLNLLGFGVLSMIATLGVIKFKKHRVLVLLCSVLILASYVTSIVLSI